MARILIIDDDEAVAIALQHVLTTEGNRVEIATNAETGLLLAQTQDFEVVITDLHWQAAGTKGLDSTRGISLVEQLHKARPQVPIVLITAYPTTDTTILAMFSRRATTFTRRRD